MVTVVSNLIMENGDVFITCFAIPGFLNTSESKSFLDVMSSLFLISFQWCLIFFVAINILHPCSHNLKSLLRNTEVIVKKIFW